MTSDIILTPLLCRWPLPRPPMTHVAGRSCTALLHTRPMEQPGRLLIIETTSLSLRTICRDRGLHSEAKVVDASEPNWRPGRPRSQGFSHGTGRANMALMVNHYAYKGRGGIVYKCKSVEGQEAHLQKVRHPTRGESNFALRRVWLSYEKLQSSSM